MTNEGSRLNRKWRIWTPWLIVIVLAIGGFLVPLVHPFGVTSSGISGAWGGALIAAGATLAGVLIAAGQARRDTVIRNDERRTKVSAVVVAEITVIADRLITIKPIIDSLLKNAPHNHPVALGNLREQYIGSMPITRSIASDLGLLPEEHVAAITWFLSELDLFLSDFHQFSVPSGNLPHSDALFLRSRLNQMCGQLGRLFEIIAPEKSANNPAGQSEPVGKILNDLSGRNQ